MTKRVETAYELFKTEEIKTDKPHYNCCQAVLIPFHDLCGIDKESAYSLGRNFGGGMGVGSVCGAVTGALMALGMLNRSREDVSDFLDKFKDKNGTLNCKELLESVDKNSSKKEFCDSLVCYCAEAVENTISSDSK